MKNKQDIAEQTKTLGVDIAKIRSDLEGLKDEAKLKQKVDELLAKVIELKKFEKEVGGKVHTLEAGLSLLEEKNDIQSGDTAETLFEDPHEIANFREKILDYKREYAGYTQESSALQRTLETLARNKLTSEEQERYKILTNRQFLKVPESERLRVVTVGNIPSEMLASGEEKHVEFTFTYDGVFNRELYIRTTAGQVLPPEVREVQSGKEVFSRKWINGEFFTAEGKRLKIHEASQIDISKLATWGELAEMQKGFDEQLEEYKETGEKEFALAALRKGIDPKFALLMWYEKDFYQKLNIDTREVMAEDFLTDIARYQDDFKDDYPDLETFHDGKVTEAFAGYVVYIVNGPVFKLAKEYGFDEKKLLSYKKTERYVSGGPLTMENVNIEGVSQEEIQRILKMKKFIPGSKEAQILFTVACQSAGLPPEWAASPQLHRILSKESNGGVGRLNYTIPKSMSTEQFKSIATTHRNNNPIGTVSTASGLGQLLLSNVDKYYPDGREGIGDALSEAVWMVRYIHDRYGNPDTAGALYGRLGVVNGVRKTFKEGY